MQDFVRPKLLSIEVTEDFRNRVKIQAIKKGKTIREYIIELIESDMEETLLESCFNK